MVPGAEASGLVAPMMARPCFTTSLPCQTMEMTGPEMTVGGKDEVKEAG